MQPRRDGMNHPVVGDPNGPTRTAREASRIRRWDALAALNTIALTPAAEEILKPYGQAFTVTEEAKAVIASMASRTRRTRLVGRSQAELARSAGASPSTVSAVVGRLRSLDLVHTSGGEFTSGRRRRAVLRYRLRWGAAMWLSDDRWHDACSAAKALARGVPPAAIRASLEEGLEGWRELDR
jgi:DNA-binding MarR family transcriptional regulator